MTAERVPFLSAVTDISAGNRKVPTSALQESGALAVVDQGQRLVAGYTDDRSLRVRVDEPVIVFGDHTRAFKYVDFPFAMGADGVKVLRAHDAFDPEYLYYYLRSCQIPSAGYSRHFKFLKEVEVPRPSLEEQREVVRILRTADRMRVRRRELNAHNVELVRSLLREISAGDGVEKRSLGEVARFVRGLTFKPGDKRPAGEGTVAVMRTKNVQSELDRTDEIHVSTELVRKPELYLREGDTLVSTANSWNLVGKACFVRHLVTPAVIGGFVTALRPLGGVVPAYLFYWFSSPPVQAAVRNLSSQTTNIANLNLKRCAEMSITVPPARLQNKFEEFARSVELRNDAVRRAIERDDELFMSLEKRAFRGEL